MYFMVQLYILTLLTLQCTSHTCVPLYTGMMLKENKTLKKLNLYQCGLQPERLEEVVKGVQVNTKLETLVLSDNQERIMPW